MLSSNLAIERHVHFVNSDRIEHIHSASFDTPEARKPFTPQRSPMAEHWAAELAAAYVAGSAEAEFVHMERKVRQFNERKAAGNA